MPEFGFPGLNPGDRWCLCAPRWQEAIAAGQAPRVVLRATHEGALSHCSLADLKLFAVDSRPPGAQAQAGISTELAVTTAARAAVLPQFRHWPNSKRQL